MNARQGDIISGLFVVAFAVFVLWESEKMPSGPAGFPQLIAYRRRMQWQFFKGLIGKFF